MKSSLYLILCLTFLSGCAYGVNTTPVPCQDPALDASEAGTVAEPTCTPGQYKCQAVEAGISDTVLECSPAGTWEFAVTCAGGYCQDQGCVEPQPKQDAGDPSLTLDASSVGDETQEDAGIIPLCCQTDQNLLACDPDEPWQCDLRPTHPTLYCNAGVSLCFVGASCQGLQGVGTVVACQ